MFQYNDDDMESEDGGGGQLLDGNYDEKNSAASFQQALKQWRHGGENKSKQSIRSKKKKSTHEAAVDTVQDKIIMPNIEFHSSKLTYGEKLLLKKYRRTNNNKDFFNQRAPISSRAANNQPKMTGDVYGSQSFNQSLNLKDHDIEIEVSFNTF
jgi:hypothetical protein